MFTDTTALSQAHPIEPRVERALCAKEISKHVAAFRRADNVRAALELAVSAVPLALLWVLMWFALDIHYAVTLLLAVPAGGFLLRLFLVQHDCGHGAFFTSRRVNDWVGRCLGVFTMTPYEFWRRTHALHHAGTGNLERRGFGDVDTLTVAEYGRLGRWGRARYRLYRHPLVLFGLGPAFLFLLQHRLPVGLMRAGWRPWASAMGTNAAILALSAGLALLVGIGPFLMIHLPIVLVAATAGVWLFYIQHQFEHGYWSTSDGWNFHEAALYGSSHFVLPRVLRWFTADIGMHHIHHLCSTVPFYRLPAVMKARPELAAVNRLTVADSVKSIRLALWDEKAGRLVPFPSGRAVRMAAMPAPAPAMAEI